MKSIYLRSCVAMACALSLVACGGGHGNLQLAGSVNGLTRDGLVLQNKGGPALVVPAFATAFAFPDLLASDQAFEVTIQSAPASAKCTVTNGKGTTGSFSISSVLVSCVTNTYTLGGGITGLDANGLVLLNGSDRVAVPAGATSFIMPAKVGDGSPYGVTVLTQPTGRTCSVQAGVGTMGAADVSQVKVICI
jgi:hypothetical protein